MATKRKKKTVSPSELVRGIDFPHKRVPGWKWIQEDASRKESSRQRLELYAGRLLDLGMREGDVVGLLSDLYWDSYFECVGNRTFEKLDLKP